MAPSTSSMNQANTLKRKRLPQQQQEPNRKKSRVVQRQNARAIAAQTSGTAFGDGEINVDRFVGAQEFAIKALEDGMKSAKKMLSTRAFQNVPRELRRRTASHNVKKVPKRLRARAAKEMREDNTPTVTAKKRKQTSHMLLRLDTAKRLKRLGYKDRILENIGKPITPKEPISAGYKLSGVKTNGLDTVLGRKPRIKEITLQKPPRPKAKFRKRQIHKAWLPTHLFHAKRAHMTPPKEPLWRMTIPLSPTAKSYRPTHRACTLRGGMAWDMSYISTIGLTGPEKSIVAFLKALGVGKDEHDGFWNGRRAAHWMSGSRAWEGWLYERECWPLKAMAPATIFWCANLTSNISDKMDDEHCITPRKEKRSVMVRVHPSAFLQLWEEILRLSKVQKPVVVVEDLRFEIGSIEVVGPGSSEALFRVLQPIGSLHGNQTPTQTLEGFWPLLENVTNPASIPAHAIIAANVTDPRLRHHLKRGAIPSVLDTQQHERLLQILSTWPLDKSPAVADIYNRKARLTACHQLPSQKAINRRKTLAGIGNDPEPVPNDPRIPILLSTSQNKNGGQGRWTLLLPWKCVLPVWYSLMYYPLSTGGTLRFGGLNQKRQTAFETGTPWFPADYPGTKAGIAWETLERAGRRKEWESRPKGKRVEFDSLKLGQDCKGEVGLGWACDWEMLVNKEEMESVEVDRQIHFVPAGVAVQRLKTMTSVDRSCTVTGALMTVKITLLGRGVPITCARIYRLPFNDVGLYEKWLALHAYPKRRSSKSSSGISGYAKDAPPHLVQRRLAASLLEHPDPRGSNPPEVPSEKDLIGFVTTGNFNLGEGKGTALGSISLGKVLDYKAWKLARDLGKQAQKGTQHFADEQLCIVREAGQVTARLARWEVV